MDKLKELRMENNFKFKDMANMLGISKTFYWQIENEKRKLSYSMAFKIAKVFKTKPDAVFYEDEKNKETIN